MRLIKDTSYKENYASRIVKIESFFEHPNPDVTKIKCCTIPGTLINVIVGLDYKPGLYVYFCVDSKINPSLLSYLNLYYDSIMNRDKTIKGFFKRSGKVKPVKLKPVYDVVEIDNISYKLPKKGCISNGFLLDLNSFKEWIKFRYGEELDDISECEFNAVSGEVTEWVSKEAVVIAEHQQRKFKQRKRKQPSDFENVLDNQFHFHYDTKFAIMNNNAFSPDDWIHISVKVHGTSICVSNVLCERHLPWYIKLWNKISPYKIPNVEYRNIYSSRGQIKNAKRIDGCNFDGYYDSNVWEYANNVIYPKLSKGMEVYAEILGYTEHGQYIQREFDYGCIKPIDKNYYDTVHYRIMVYRIELVNPDGIRHEFSPREVQQWCMENGIEPVRELYYGQAKNLYPDLQYNDEWYANFISRIAVDKRFGMEELEPMCNNKVPREGIVIKVDNMHPNAYKVKCDKFYEITRKEIEDGISNIEDNE